MLYIKLCLKGLCIGASNVVPGISGGMVAVMLGIYEELIYSINNLQQQTKKSLQFILPLGVGVLLGILSLGSLIDYCLNRFSFQTGCFLAGLVAGSFPLVYRKTKNNSQLTTVSCQLPTLHSRLLILLGLLIVIAITIFKSPISELTPEINISIKMIFYLFLGGVLASASMIVPGISGAFVLMLLGLYTTILSVITQIKGFIFSFGNSGSVIFILSVIIPLGLGILTGIYVMSKCMGFLFKKYYYQTYNIILGMVIGTIYSILMDPLSHQSYGVFDVIILFTGIGCFIFGGALVIRIAR